MYHKIHNTGIYLSFVKKVQEMTPTGNKPWTEHGIKSVFRQLGKIASCRIVNMEGYVPSCAVIRFKSRVDA